MNNRLVYLIFLSFLIFFYFLFLSTIQCYIQSFNMLYISLMNSILLPLIHEFVTIACTKTLRSRQYFLLNSSRLEKMIVNPTKNVKPKFHECQTKLKLFIMRKTLHNDFYSPQIIYEMK